LTEERYVSLVDSPPIIETVAAVQPEQPDSGPAEPPEVSANDPSEDEDKLADPRMIPKAETESLDTEMSVKPTPKDEESGTTTVVKTDEIAKASDTPLIDQLRGNSQMIEVKTEEALMTSENSEDEETALVTTSEGRILIDSGATGNLMSCQWAEQHIPGNAVINIDPNRNRGYRFANAQSGICSSELTVRTKLGVLKFDILETEAPSNGPATPALLGIRTLRELGALLDLSRDELKTTKGTIHLSRGQNGHLYIAAQDFFDCSTAALSVEDPEILNAAKAGSQDNE
jgi:hypothetical protein